LYPKEVPVEVLEQVLQEVVVVEVVVLLKETLQMVQAVHLIQFLEIMFFMRQVEVEAMMLREWEH
jgi:hypothetical protein